MQLLPSPALNESHHVLSATAAGNVLLCWLSSAYEYLVSAAAALYQNFGTCIISRVAAGNAHAGFRVCIVSAAAAAAL